MRLAVVGASGRMGRELISAIERIEGAELCGAIERKGSSFIGKDAATLIGSEPHGVIISDDATSAFKNAEGILDFSSPEASISYTALAAQMGIVHIIGTTGFNLEQEEAIKAAATKTTIVKSGNMSLGVNLLMGLVEKAAKALGPDDFDIEIYEMHHRKKVDAPSGTALLLGQAAADGRGVDLDTVSVRSRDGYTGARENGTIGFATARGGTVIGDHTVTLAGDNERIVLSHFAQDRSIFANGAVKAALWAKGHKKGLYSMLNVLGLND